MLAADLGGSTPPRFRTFFILDCERPVTSDRHPTPLELWKIERELRRLGQQLQAVPEFFFEPATRWWHDRRRAHRLKTSAGDAPLGGKVAVYLVYQPQGLAGSTLLACEHLRACGYAPMVVSNAPLSAEDRRRLQQSAWRVVERPNFGYDFGGYRDGIWLLQQWQVSPTHLILMNDSIWYPARRDDRTVERMEAMPEDFCGILRLGDDHERTGRRRRPAFLGSFFLMFKQQALASAAFQQFWASYQCTGNKYKTIRRGERGISAAMRGAGLSWASVFGREQFHGLVQGASLPALRRMLDEVVIIDSRLDAERRQVMTLHDQAPPQEQPSLRPRMEGLLITATSRVNIFSSAPISTLRDFHIPFIKKAGDVPNAKGLQRLVTALDAHPGMLEMPEVVERELRQRVASRR